jgi:ABC-type multidrug transport system fused ATPase/permease subunit
MLGFSILGQIYLSNASASPKLPENFILIYAVLRCLPGTLGFTYCLAIYLGSLVAARKLHILALKGVLRAPTSFFEFQPIGRLINRFSNDFDAVDWNISNMLEYLVVAALNLIVTIILVTLSTWYMLFVIALAGVCLRFLFVFYQKTNIAMKRLQSIIKSPQNAHLNDSIAGHSTVRIFGMEETFISTQKNLRDKVQSSNFIKNSLSIWMGVRLSFITCMITLCLLCFIQIFKISASMSGVALLNAIQSADAIEAFLNWITQGEAEVILLLM